MVGRGAIEPQEHRVLLDLIADGHLDPGDHTIEGGDDPGALEREGDLIELGAGALQTRLQGDLQELALLLQGVAVVLEADLLAPDLRLQVVDLGRRPLQARQEVPFVELHHEVAPGHPIAVAHRDPGDAPGTRGGGLEEIRLISARPWSSKWGASLSGATSSTSTRQTRSRISATGHSGRVALSVLKAAKPAVRMSSGTNWAWWRVRSCWCRTMRKDAQH